MAPVAGAVQNRDTPALPALPLLSVFVQCQTSEGYSAALVVVLYSLHRQISCCPCTVQQCCKCFSRTHGMNEDL
jgi:hypothetical protein